MLFEPADENLQRIFQDSMRTETGLVWLDQILGSTLPSGCLSLLLLDLDGSAVVRQRGIEAKIFLVQQMLQLVRAHLGPEDYLINSGTRDEMLVVLPRRTLEESLARAENLRAIVQQHTFLLDDSSYERIRLTVSIGVVTAPEAGCTAFDLSWAAREALQEAKRTTNKVHALTTINFTTGACYLYQNQYNALVALSDSLGRAVESLFHEALARLFDRQKGLWYWSVERWEQFHAFQKLSGVGQSEDSLGGVLPQGIVIPAWIPPGVLSLDEYAEDSLRGIKTKACQYALDIGKLRMEALLDLAMKQQGKSVSVYYCVLKLPLLPFGSSLRWMQEISRNVSLHLPHESFIGCYNSDELVIMYQNDKISEMQDIIEHLPEVASAISVSSTLPEVRWHAISNPARIDRDNLNNSLDVLELARAWALQGEGQGLRLHRLAIPLSPHEQKKLDSLAILRGRSIDGLLREAVATLLSYYSPESRFNRPKLEALR